MNTLTTGLSFVDVHFQGVERIIASALLHGSAGVAIVDPGPSSSLDSLRRELASAGLSIRDVTSLLLTHIHLDHAGAAGTLVHENPAIRVYVHEHGAPHMIRPEKLLASAARLYGDAMDRLWGEVRDVPAASIVALKGGERLDVAGRFWDVVYTPGHASHHVSYFSRDAGVAFVGDTAGVKVLPSGITIPPTPPPDIDLELWRDSIARIAQRTPDTLFLTHFGPVGSSSAHLAEFGRALEWAGGLASASLARDEDDDARERWFCDQMRLELRRRMAEKDAELYEFAAPFDLCWKGLARYWRKRSER